MGRKDYLARLKRAKSEKAAAGLATRARTSEYQTALDELDALCGNRRQAMDGPTGGFTFKLSPARKKSFKLEKVQGDFLKRGCYVFSTRLSDSDRIGVFPTTDKYAVVLAMGTSGANWDVGTKDVVAWLRKLEKAQPYVLTTVAEDGVCGRFTTKTEKPEELAWRVLELCPDLENPDEVEKDLRRGRLWLWWT